MEQLKNRRDRVAEDLQLDPGVIAPRQALDGYRENRKPSAPTDALATTAVWPLGGKDRRQQKNRREFNKEVMKSVAP